MALTHVREHQALEAVTDSNDAASLSPDAVPGMLLHVAMLNLFSDSMVLVIVFSYPPIFLNVFFVN